MQYINNKKIWTRRKEAEKKVGRKLLKGEPVHHIDGNKLNNSHDNLYICADKKEHGLIHSSLEYVAFEFFKEGLIGFDENTGKYFKAK